MGEKMKLGINDLNLCYCSIYVAFGIYKPDENLDQLLYENENTTAHILGEKSFSNKVDKIYPSLNSESQDEKTKKDIDKNRIKRNSLYLHATSNAILYIESRIPFNEVGNYKDEKSELSTYDLTPLKNKSEYAFKITSSAITFSRGSILRKDYDQIYSFYHIEDKHQNILDKIAPSIVIPSGGKMMTITTQEVQSAKELVNLLEKNKEMNQILNLYSDSLTPYIKGHLFSFVSAWTALEVFIVKQFKSLQSKISIHIDGDMSHDIFSQRILNVMNDKYRLLDKFVYLSSYYNKFDAQKDIDNFKKLKKIRDDFFHKMEGEINELPLDEVKELFIKYFHFYLEKTNENIFIIRDS